MKPNIVFLVMSAVGKPETLDQLAHSLAPHTVLVHHDFSQTPDFVLTAPNVRFVPDPKRTGWAFFGFVDGIFHSMKYALANLVADAHRNALRADFAITGGPPQVTLGPPYGARIAVSWSWSQTSGQPSASLQK